jgi:hypothetical protein
MADTKFGRDRHKPIGDWVQTTIVEEVAGIQHRKDDARAFMHAVRKAEAERLRYGVELEPEPTNPHDPNAIAVLGTSVVKGWLSSAVRKWKIGYLARDLAKEINRDLISKGVPIAAELYDVTLTANDFIAVRLIVLAPTGHSHKIRLRTSDDGKR